MAIIQLQTPACPPDLEERSEAEKSLWEMCKLCWNREAQQRPSMRDIITELLVNPAESQQDTATLPNSTYGSPSTPSSPTQSSNSALELPHDEALPTGSPPPIEHSSSFDPRPTNRANNPRHGVVQASVPFGLVSMPEDTDTLSPLNCVNPGFEGARRRDVDDYFNPSPDSMLPYFAPTLLPYQPTGGPTGPTIGESVLPEEQPCNNIATNPVKDESGLNDMAMSELDSLAEGDQNTRGTEGSIGDVLPSEDVGKLHGARRRPRPSVSTSLWREAVRPLLDRNPLGGSSTDSPASGIGTDIDSGPYPTSTASSPHASPYSSPHPSPYSSPYPSPEPESSPYPSPGSSPQFANSVLGKAGTGNDRTQVRRKTDASFVCPVPGCGSTFTRYFNFKGELLWYTSPS